MEPDYTLDLAGAESLHMQGRLDEALTAYRKLLAVNPNEPKLLMLYGTLMLQTGKPEIALDFLLSAVKNQPGNVPALNNLGLTYQNLEQHEDAVNCFRKAIAISPQYKNAYNNLGISLARCGRYPEAVECYNNLLSLGNPLPDTYYNLALCHQYQGNYDEALAAYRVVLETEPEHTQTLLNVGTLYRARGQRQKADKVFRRILEIDPVNTEALFNISALLVEDGGYDEAAPGLQKVLSIEPEYKEALNELGKVRFLQMRLEESLTLYKQCITVDNNWWLGYYNCGVVLYELGEFEESITFLKKAAGLNSTEPKIHFALAESMLAAGDFENGLIEYEYRFLLDSVQKRENTAPVWQGQNLMEKKLYVYEEQGSGDTFQFIRYLEILKGRGAEITFECKPAHYRLINELKWIDNILQGPDSVIESGCDYSVPLLSIPLLLLKELQSVPNQTPYIFAPEKLTEFWRSRMHSAKLKAGIVWSGNRVSGINHKRHCKPEDLIPLLQISDIQFYSLQVDDAGIRAADLLSKYSVIDLSSEITDFADTAAIMANLDIVISVDTAAAHLAGAMGIETYLLLAKVPDWRWQGADTYTRWYPSVTLLRQSIRQNWADPINKLKEHLHAKLNNDFSGLNPLVLALSSGENYGWGVCSKYLNILLEKKTRIQKYDAAEPEYFPRSVMFHAVDADLNPITRGRGRANIAYTFFENELSEKAVVNSKNFDLVLGGSTWNRKKLEACGINHSDMLIQGIDPSLFYPAGPKKDENLFVIFSGGKFELRKGQDLVLRAFEILHKKYPDMILINIWYNMWPASMLLMQYSRYIKFDIKGETWEDIMANLYAANGIDPSRVFTLPLTRNEQLRQIYSRSDIGLFPNRCEGGTNLVLMEYMACGRPVIASYNSGHKDILTDENSYRLMTMKPFRMYDNEHLTADWEEPALEEILTKLEYAYHHRGEINSVGECAGKDMQNYTWDKTADAVLNFAKKL